ncbi:hypothetical protein Tfer_1067 [Thermincola ferriacetica]|uniref:DUF445 domain-containing protein n=2 Tax=Thermincola TaxID=278993 RepID=D5X808_THEPJ|nr:MULTISPECIES: DUF445 family protein [Thermincola]ADG82728.1 protein of unknown function DUF445 [Thermincola potens JR]KNZ70193.1 hypothetical protein Tfer_1067 [Thermincola ferriacetica]
MDWKLLTIPVISALIGWITNVLAIKMLFWPYKPVKIPLTNWVFQGVIPKRQKEMAKNLGEIIEGQLLCVEDVLAQFSSHRVTANFEKSAKEIIKSRIMQKIPNFLPISIRHLLGQAAEEILDREMPKIIDRVMDKMAEHLREDLHVAPIVEEKVNNFNLQELEQLIFGIASRELKHIEVLGGVLGFFIGCLQVILLQIRA